MGNNQKWIGRFAPSPSGELHFGSLVAALGSYLVARQNSGEWLVRIEDLDPPREVAGAADSILRTLEAFGFEWEQPVVYQSQRQQFYLAALEVLQSKKLVYHCDCSRKAVSHRNQGVYDAFCRSRNLDFLSGCAIRVKFESGFADFSDEILGACSFRSAENTQDFIIRRRDGLFAYQLAVVVDDIQQKVNHVVRGADILDSTPRQNYLHHCLESTPPIYYHLPLVVDENGNKLSKSKFSPMIKVAEASHWLVCALHHLGQNTPTELNHLSPREILAWAVNNWDIQKVGRSARQIN